MMRLLTTDELFWIAGGDGGGDGGGSDGGSSDSGDGGCSDGSGSCGDGGGDSSEGGGGYGGGPSADCDDGSSTNTSTASTTSNTNTTSTQASTTEESTVASTTNSGWSFSVSTIGDWDSDRPGAWNAPEPEPGTFWGGFSDMVNSENFYQDAQGNWNYDLGHALGFGYAVDNPNNPGTTTSAAFSGPDVYAGLIDRAAGWLGARGNKAAEKGVEVLMLEGAIKGGKALYEYLRDVPPEIDWERVGASQMTA